MLVSQILKQRNTGVIEIEGGRPVPPPPG